jgi:hypothetical protein
LKHSLRQNRQWKHITNWINGLEDKSLKKSNLASNEMMSPWSYMRACHLCHRRKVTKICRQTPFVPVRRLLIHFTYFHKLLCRSHLMAKVNFIHRWCSNSSFDMLIRVVRSPSSSFINDPSISDLFLRGIN